MKRFLWFGLILGLALPAAAQFRQGGVPVSGPAFGFGFGNVVFPGGAPANPVRAFSITNPGFASNLGGIVGGFRPYTGAPVGGSFHRRGGATLVGVPYPVVMGGFGYYDPTQPPQSPSVVFAPPQQPAPTVIINQTFVTRPDAQSQTAVSPDTSGIQVYQAPSGASAQGTAAPSQEATIYLIAFKDSSIRSAVAYWVDGDSLLYVTPQGQMNKASLALIDRDYSNRLNRERNVPFELLSAN
jgi:hypothetical protein